MRKLILLILLVFANILINKALCDDPLLPDQAFKFSIEVNSSNSLKATWDIAEGHYLYKKRFAFIAETEGISLDKPIYPKSEKKYDINFNKEIEIYHGKISVKIPFKSDNLQKITQLKIKTKYQGCSEKGLCYPPIKKESNLQLSAKNTDLIQKTANIIAAPAPVNTVVKPISTNNILDRLTKNKKPLTVDEAFTFKLSIIDKNTLNAHWTLVPGHQIYRNKINFSLKEDPQGITLGKIKYPKGVIVDDAYYGKIEVYDKGFNIKIPIKGRNIRKLTLLTKYQGCAAQDKICYPPVEKTNTLKFNKIIPEISGQNEELSEEQIISKQMEEDSYPAILLSFLAAGIMLSLTPCVFPMIPILSGIITGQAETISTRKAFFLSLAYVLSMAVTYAIVGVLAGLSGESLQATLQLPWVISLFAALLILLSLSMFGFYELQMPVSIQGRLSELSNKQEGGSLISAGIMGIFSAIIVGPCITAPLAGALLYITTTNDALLGGLSLFTLGIGMGIPLLVIGTSAGKLLPKTGAWMETTKAIFGILLLAMAIWMLSRVVPIEITMFLSAVLLLTSGVYMGGLDPITEDTDSWGRFWKSLGMILIFQSGVLLFGLAIGSKDILQPLKDSFSPDATATQLLSTNGKQENASKNKLDFQIIKGIPGLEAALKKAKQESRYVMLDFYADWCTSCKELENFTFTDPKLKKVLGNTLLIKADVTANDEQDKALLKKLVLFTPPSLLFFSPEGKEFRKYRVVGMINADKLINHIGNFMPKK